MITPSRLYQCQTCGRLIKVLHQGEGELYCCGAALTFSGQGGADGSCELLLDLIEVKGEGQAYWHFPTTAEIPGGVEAMRLASSSN